MQLDGSIFYDERARLIYSLDEAKFYARNLANKHGKDAIVWGVVAAKNGFLVTLADERPDAIMIKNVARVSPSK